MKDTFSIFDLKASYEIRGESGSYTCFVDISWGENLHFGSFFIVNSMSMFNVEIKAIDRILNYTESKFKHKKVLIFVGDKKIAEILPDTKAKPMNPSLYALVQRLKKINKGETNIYLFA